MAGNTMGIEPQAQWLAAGPPEEHDSETEDYIGKCVGGAVW